MPLVKATYAVVYEIFDDYLHRTQQTLDQAIAADAESFLKEPETLIGIGSISQYGRMVTIGPIDDEELEKWSG